MITLTTALLANLAMPGLQAKPAAKLQGQTAEKPSREQLAKAVAKAHRTGTGSLPTIDSYRARIKLSGKVGDTTGSVSLKVRYAKAIERAPGKQKMAMLYYETVENNKPLKRGYGPTGPWQKIGDKKVENLLSRDHQTDRDLVKSHLRLCKVMLRFLDPGVILSRLRDGTAVYDVPLRVGIGRKNLIQTHLVSGTLSGFPVGGQGKEVKDQMVWMEAWIDKKTSMLRAVRVRPWTAKGKTKAAEGEDIVFARFESHNGRLLPTELKLYDVKGNTRGKPKLTITLESIELNSKLTRKDFRAH